MGGKNEAKSADGKVADDASAQDMAARGMGNEKAGAAGQKEAQATSDQDASGEMDSARLKKNGESASELTNHLKRLAAEFDNYKKRAEKERGESKNAGAARVIADLLPFLDELEMAASAAEKSQDTALKAGMKMLCSKFRGTLEKEGLAEMNPLGEKFDPYRHEAVMHEESGEEEGTIVKVLRKGYLLDGRILRHAMVSVSKTNNDPKAEAKKE